jgi:hypothetical protein
MAKWYLEFSVFVTEFVAELRAAKSRRTAALVLRAAGHDWV